MFPQPGNHGIVRPPPLDSPLLTYDEDTIVSLILQIFNILVALGYIPAEEITFPPGDTGRHELNATLCDQLHIAPRVRSLLQRLPYLRSGARDEIPVFIDSLPICYLDDTELLESRDPHSPTWPDQSPRGPEYMRPTDVALTRALDREGYSWIIDTEANTIRRLHSYDEVWDYAQSCQGYVAEVPLVPEHYRNCPAYPAEAVLGQYIKQLRSLEILPRRAPEGHSELLFGWDDMLPNEAPNIVRRRLLHEYGWPDQFRREDWLADREDVWELAEATGEESRSQRRQRELEERFRSGTMVLRPLPP